MESRPDPDQVYRDLLETNRALLEELRANRQFRDALRDEQRRAKRVAWIVLLVMVGLMALLPLALCLLPRLFYTPPLEGVESEDPVKRYERQLDRVDRQLDRNEKLFERADALLGRWEKAAAKE